MPRTPKYDDDTLCKKINPLKRWLYIFINEGPFILFKEKCDIIKDLQNEIICYYILTVLKPNLNISKSKY